MIPFLSSSPDPSTEAGKQQDLGLQVVAAGRRGGDNTALPKPIEEHSCDRVFRYIRRISLVIVRNFIRTTSNLLYIS